MNVIRLFAAVKFASEIPAAYFSLSSVSVCIYVLLAKDWAQSPPI